MRKTIAQNQRLSASQTNQQSDKPATSLADIQKNLDSNRDETNSSFKEKEPDYYNACIALKNIKPLVPPA
jgi:hypothetical protein